MLTDIEIAQNTKMKPIAEIASMLGITDEELIPYGRYKANENLNLIYEFLEDIGYEMSDEENELISGESELYVKPEEQNNG